MRASETPARLAASSSAAPRVCSGWSRSAPLRSTISAIRSTNHGSIADSAATSSIVAPAASRSATACSRVSPGVATSVSEPPPPHERSSARFSMPRHALPSASVNVRPIAIVSPTDFIVEESTGEASGNFSNANRGIFTTT